MTLAVEPAPSARTLPSYPRLHELMRRYEVKDLVGLDTAALLRRIDAFHELDDPAFEGFADGTRQHPVAVRFHWGHRHDFGTFCMPGRMGNHHVAILAAFIDALDAIPIDLAGQRVLDVGCWTGGTSLLLAAMGAEVVAIEEVRKYAECARFLAESFNTPVDVRHESLYDCTGDAYGDAFDLVLLAGVLHHLSDPKVALRIVFNCLRDGGRCLIETRSFDDDEQVATRRVAAPEPGSAQGDDAWGWNWLLFTPGTLTTMLESVGFAIESGPAVLDGRMFVCARRDVHVDVSRAGLSRRDLR